MSDNGFSYTRSLSHAFLGMKLKIETTQERKGAARLAPCLFSKSKSFRRAIASWAV